MKYCKNCGKPLLDTDKFCSECGTQVLNLEPPAAPEVKAHVVDSSDENFAEKTDGLFDGIKLEHPGDALHWNTDIFPDKEEPKAKALLAHVAEVIKDAEAEYGEHLQMKDYYMGLSDLSYTGLAPDKNFDGLFENVVGVDQMYSLPVTDLKKFYVPSIVLGGYGKDFHKHTERLHKHYNFDVLPHLYTDLIDRIFGQRKD